MKKVKKTIKSKKVNKTKVNAAPSVEHTKVEELKQKKTLRTWSFDIFEQRRLYRSIVIVYGLFNDKFYQWLERCRPKEVFILEGRPNLESSRHNAKELIRRGIKPTLISDNMAGFLFYKNLVKEVQLTYQETDEEKSLCLIGSLILAVLAKKHHVPVFLTPAIKKVEETAKPEEVLSFNGVRVAPKGIKGYVPLVEWVGKDYITRKF